MVYNHIQFGTTLLWTLGGNVYMHCFAIQQLNIKDEQIIIKYDPSGNILNTFQPGKNHPDFTNEFNVMQIDSSGNIYLAGYTLDWNNTINKMDFYTIKYTQRQPNIYTITATSGANGSLDQQGSIQVNEQQTLHLTAQPLFEHDPYFGYTVDKWFLDGVPRGTIGKNVYPRRY